MAQIVVTGGGVAGLAAAMLLAEDGHEVTLLERDAAEPPAPTEAWEAWERRGVNQFRLLHFFMPRFRIDARAGAAPGDPRRSRRPAPCASTPSTRRPWR